MRLAPTARVKMASAIWWNWINSLILAALLTLIGMSHAYAVGWAADVYLALPYFDALHRFMPALVKREGFSIAHVDVIDRPRLTGVSNYGFFDRLWVGIVDLAGVRWLIRRRKKVPQAQEVSAP